MSIVCEVSSTSQYVPGLHIDGLTRCTIDAIQCYLRKYASFTQRKCIMFHEQGFRVIIFSGRNVNRIYKENILYKYNPFKQPFYKVDDAYFNEYKNLKK